MSSDTPASVESPENQGSSPYPGCFILIAIIVVFGGLVVLYTVVGIYQNRAIGDFTQERPAAIELLTPSPGQMESAEAKLKAIRDAVSAGVSERIIFSAEDLNVLIASKEELKDFRSQTYVERISPQGIVAKMAQPMRKGIIDKTPRYLNATFIFQSEVRARTVAFKVLDIRSDVGEIPQGFKDNYAVLDFFRLDPDLEAMKSHIKSIAAIYVEAGKVVVETKVPEPEILE